MAHTNRSRSYQTNRAAMDAIGDELETERLALTPEEEQHAQRRARELAADPRYAYRGWRGCLMAARHQIALGRAA